MKLIKKLVRLVTEWAWRHEKSVCDGIATLQGLSIDDAGMEIKIKQDPALALWVAKCFASMVAESPNYTEMRFELVGKYKGKYEWVTVLIQKGGGKTPHQLRREAEADRDELRRKLDAIESGNP